MHVWGYAPHIRDIPVPFKRCSESFGRCDGQRRSLAHSLSMQFYSRHRPIQSSNCTLIIHNAPRIYLYIRNYVYESDRILSDYYIHISKSIEPVYINTSPASPASPASPPPDTRIYFSGAGKMFLNTSQAFPAPEKCI